MGYIALGEIRSFPTTVAQNYEGVGKPLTTRDMAEKIWAIDNLPSKYHPTVFDKGPYDRSNTWLDFVEWRMSCEENHAVEYVETTPTERFVIPSGAEPVFYNIGGLKMADVEGIYDFRHTGILAHKAHDLQGHMRDLITSDVGEELAIQHGDLLSKAPSIEYIMIEKDQEGIYGMMQICEHSAILVGNWDSYEIKEALAKREGIVVNDMILRGMLEEGLHLIRRGKATVQEEIDVRLMMIDIYSALAGKALDSKVKERYNKMVRYLERDLSEVEETYSKIYSKNVNSLVEMYSSDRGKLEMILEAEAIMEEGLEGKAVEEYVASRLEQVAEAAEEYSGDGNLDAEMSEYSGEGDVDGEYAEVCAEGGDGEACAEAGEGESSGGGE